MFQDHIRKQEYFRLLSLYGKFVHAYADNLTLMQFANIFIFSV